MQAFEKENEGFFEQENLVEITPLFNSDEKLEFSLAPNGYYAILNESRLKFQVDIPDSYVVQNYFCAKLFTHIEIVCNHTSLSYKSTENDHALSVYFSTVINSEEINLKTTGNLDGYWSNNTLGSTSFYKRLLPAGDSTSVGEIRRHHPEVQARELGSTDYETTDSHGNKLKFKRYFFMHKLDFGLAQREHPLPKDVNLRIIFYRAQPKKSLLSVHLNDQDQDEGGYNERSIPFINPVLQVKYAESKKYDKKYSSHRISRVKFPFLTKTVRREVLHKGIANFKFTVANGRLPIALCFALTTPELFDGSITEPLTNFKAYGLRSFDLVFNSRSLSGYPLKASGSNLTEFYFSFLEQVNLNTNKLSLTFYF